MGQTPKENVRGGFYLMCSLNLHAFGTWFTKTAALSTQSAVGAQSAAGGGGLINVSQFKAAKCIHFLYNKKKVKLQLSVTSHVMVNFKQV